MTRDKTAIQEKVAQVLQENSVMNVATQSDQGPWCNTLYFVEEGFDLLCLVESGGRTMANLKRNHRAAFTINRQTPDRFLQGSGTAYVIGPPAENPELFDSMCRKQPQLREFVETVPGLVIVRIVSERLALSDVPAGIFPRASLARRGDDWLLTGEAPALTGAKAWLMGLRPYSFPASLMSMLVGVALAYRDEFFDLPLFLLTLVGGLCFHAGANLVNTYFDFQRGLDSARDSDDRTLVDSIMLPRQVLAFAVALFLIGGGIGGYLVWESGWEILALGAVGLALGVFYTAEPLGFKYLALGDIGIFVAFGPLLVMGAYFVQTEELAWQPFFFSIPLGLMVDAILHGNNFRDAEADRRVGGRTLAQFLGQQGSRYAYWLLLLSPYAFAIGFAATVSPWVLLPIASVPLALRLARSINVSGAELKRALAFLPQQTAQLVLLYGGLMALGILGSELLAG
jgi:1,4-dihydroxy-2-naphthoate octaprenyltransferase